MSAVAKRRQGYHDRRYLMCPAQRAGVAAPPPSPQVPVLLVSSAVLHSPLAHSSAEEHTAPSAFFALHWVPLQ